MLSLARFVFDRMCIVFYLLSFGNWAPNLGLCPSIRFSPVVAVGASLRKGQAQIAEQQRASEKVLMAEGPESMNVEEMTAQAQGGSADKKEK